MKWQLKVSHSANVGRLPRRAAMVVLATALSGTLLAEVATEPSWAASAHTSEPAALGGFALGDGLEGLVDPGAGAFSFTLPAAGLAVSWDSRASGVDRAGLGGGWSIAGVAHVSTQGGVQVTPASGGVYAADASVPSGLAGYLPRDLVFAQHPKTVPARADGQRGEQAAAFELVELGGVRTYFSAAGDPVVRFDANGNRADWEWQPDHRLVRAIDHTGLVSALDWSDPGRVEVTTGAGRAWGVTATLELDGGRLVTVTDASGGRVHVGYTGAGLVERLSAGSGANTEVTWQRLDDGRSAVDRVRVVDASTGAELSARRWEARAGSASGWPSLGEAAGATLRDDTADGYLTTVTDGSTSIGTAFDAAHRVLERDMTVTARGGALVVQRQTYTYPERDGGGEMPAQSGQPTEATVTHFDASGGQRTERVTFAADELGRVTREVAEDGTITEIRFDDVLAAGGPVPIGLPVSRRVTAPDGLVEETRHELNASRTAHVATETYTGRAGDTKLTRTGRVEFDVEPDGFVSQERRYPQGGAGTPFVTDYAKRTDLLAGTVTTATTVAVGTPSAATTTQVLHLLHGGVLHEQGPAGAPVTARYDASGRVVEQTDAAGNRAATEYRTVQDDGENAAIVTGPDGVVTTTTTDVLGRPVRVADNVLDGVATPGHVRVAETREYPEPGSIRVTDAWGAVSTSRQDVYGRIVHSVGPGGSTELSAYDDVANTVTTGSSQTGRLADALSTTTTRHDGRGQATETSGTRSDGVNVPTKTTAFDGFGRANESSDGATTTNVAFDALGNPVSTTITPEGASSAGPTTATREFDPFGASTVKTLTTGVETRAGGVLTFDELGRTRSRTDQAGGTSAQEYTVDGLVASTVTSYGQSTRNEYDPDTRALTLTETTSPIGATVSTGYDYDPVTGELVGVFDPNDRAGTEIRYEYDAWGNPTRTSYPDGAVIEHEYDQHGRQIATTDIAGNTTRYQHDPTGLVTTATQTNQAGHLLAEVAYEYDGYGRLIEQARSNGITTTYAYTSANQIASETATRTDGTTVTERAYVYDERGNLATRTDTRPDPDSGAPATTTTAYSYDGYDRLTDSAVHDGPSTDTPARTTTSYELTVGGDIHAEHVTNQSGATTSRVFDYGPTGTLTSVTTTNPDGTVTSQAQEYDPAGNLTLALDGTRYTYDATNQPVTETTPDGVTIRTGYWASGQRATHTQNGTTSSTVFHWDGSTLLNDTHTGHVPAATGDMAGAGASVTAAYLLGVGRHARTLGSAASTVFSEADFHGNITELTGPDANVTTSYDYTDYGITTTQHADGEPDAGPLVGDAHRNPFQYAGEYTNPTGTQHLQIRTYDPTTMRLASVDPEPQHNRYHYAALNPITLADPTGRISDAPTWVYAVLAGIGVAMSLVGVAAAGLGVAAAVATAAPTIGAKVGLFSTIAAATVDLGVTALTTAHHYKPDFLNADVAFGLGVAGAMVGVLTAVAGFGVRAMNRLEIDAYVEEGAGPTMAEHMIALEKQLGQQAQEAYAAFDLNYDVEAIVKNLHANVKAAKMVPTDPTNSGSPRDWDTQAHYLELGDLSRAALVHADRTVEVSEEVGATLRRIEAAERYSPYVFPAAIRPIILGKLRELRGALEAVHVDTFILFKKNKTYIWDPTGLAYSNRYGLLSEVFRSKKSKRKLGSTSSPALIPKEEKRADTLDTILDED